MPHAYIPFTPDRQRHLDVINAYLHGLGIYPIGRFGEWKYVNQDGAILSAKRVVESIQSGEKLRGRAAPRARPRNGPASAKPDAAATATLAAGSTARPDRGPRRQPARGRRGRPGRPICRAIVASPALRASTEASGWNPIRSSRPSATSPDRRRRAGATRTLPWVRLGPGRRYFETEDGRAVPDHRPERRPDLAGAGGAARPPRPGVPSTGTSPGCARSGVTTLRVMLEYVGDGLYLECTPRRVRPGRRPGDRRPGRRSASAHGLRLLLTPFDTFFTWVMWDDASLQRRTGAARAGVSSTC